jgi:hypothetical protein
VFKSVSQTFWKTAIEEFNTQTHKYRDRLNSLEIELPRHLKIFLSEEYEHEFDLLGCAGNETKEKESSYLLKAINSPVSCEFLLIFLFNRVFWAMYNPEWGGKSDALMGVRQKLNDCSL